MSLKYASKISTGSVDGTGRSEIGCAIAIVLERETRERERAMGVLRRISSRTLLFPRVLESANRSLNTLPVPSTPLSNGIHVLYCPDSVGIVAKISECIASRGGNILEADIFVPQNKNDHSSYLLYRGSGIHCQGAVALKSEFVFDPTKWPRAQMDEDVLNLSKKFNANRSVVRVPSLDPKYKIAVLASKQDHCLVDLLHAWQDGKLPVDISSIISNHDRLPNSHVIRFLERHNIPYHYLSTTKENKREDEILHLVQDTDFLVLARYMQVLSRSFLNRYKKDIINIHHGLLPSFKGGNPSRQAFNAGVKLIGATSHFVTEELDEGPIIEQMVERVSHKDNLLSFVQKSENLEKQCLLKAIKSYCELRVLPYEENRTVANGTQSFEGAVYTHHLPSDVMEYPVSCSPSSLF
ncbi:Formyltetrahydrofolate deformylase [Cynara cardunculus var. scolymus]|uniref:Formyltetrahydrofolate deformylase n=1 Tax=Cynara cardunculus var. scolymus TaxID=59895 RepID=A0A103XFG1_CYNCS|nr:Formyltetrahydrofolate deformylase [Cynara cardunculus var. scolymus]